MNEQSKLGDDAQILQVFADTGVETEVLSAYGNITRIGIDPIENPFSKVIKADGKDIPISEEFDLSIWHPPCQKWSIATQGGGKGRDSHPDLIEEAREQAKEYSRNYIIENVPNAPLENPTILNGQMFGLPIKYERAFETNYHLPQPTQKAIHPPVTGWDIDRGTKGWAWIGNKELWKNVKGYSYDWPAEPLKKSAVPRPYLSYLIRPLIDEWDGESSVTKDNPSKNMDGGESVFDF